MQVFGHHLYEYCKGLRNLVLHTLEHGDVENAVRRLDSAGIDYVTYPVNSKRVNLFFGASECVEVVRRFNKPCLNDYSPEEDFMLGIMLGYERRKQCERYLEQCQTYTRPRLCQCATKGACAH